MTGEMEEAGTVTGEEVVAEQSEGAEEQEQGQEEETDEQEEGESTGDEEAEGEGEEGEAEGEPEKKKGPVKLPANERIQQLTHKVKELEDQLAAKFEEMEKQVVGEKKPYVEVSQKEVETELTRLYEEEEVLRAEGRIYEAAQKGKERNELLAALDLNESKRKEWEAKQAAAKSDQERQTQRFQRLDRAAEFYREHASIPKEVWDENGKWFADKLSSDPLLAREWAERLEASTVDGFRWAHKYIVDNRGKQVAEEKAKKEAAKKASVGKASSGNPAPKVKSFQALLDGPSAELNRFAKEHPKEFDKLFEAHMKRKA